MRQTTSQNGLLGLASAAFQAAGSVVRVLGEKRKLRLAQRANLMAMSMARYETEHSPLSQDTLDDAVFDENDRPRDDRSPGHELLALHVDSIGTLVHSVNAQLGCDRSIAEEVRRAVLARHLGEIGHFRGYQVRRDGIVLDLCDSANRSLVLALFERSESDESRVITTAYKSMSDGRIITPFQYGQMNLNDRPRYRPITTKI